MDNSKLNLKFDSNLVGRGWDEGKDHASPSALQVYLLYSFSCNCTANGGLGLRLYPCA